MHVYRIEHRTLMVGPWQCGAVWLYDSKHRVKGQHSAYDPPGPRSSGEVGTELHDLFWNGSSREHEPYVFGFKSKAQLRRWFKSKAGRRAMSSEGETVLRVYQVDRANVAKGNWQVAFRQDAATHVDTLDLETLKPLGNA